jgi:hypothetical protein
MGDKGIASLKSLLNQASLLSRLTRLSGKSLLDLMMSDGEQCRSGNSRLSFTTRSASSNHAFTSFGTITYQVTWIWYNLPAKSFIFYTCEKRNADPLPTPHLNPALERRAALDAFAAHLPAWRKGYPRSLISAFSLLTAAGMCRGGF